MYVCNTSECVTTNSSSSSNSSRNHSSSSSSSNTAKIASLYEVLITIAYRSMTHIFALNYHCPSIISHELSIHVSTITMEEDNSLFHHSHPRILSPEQFSFQDLYDYINTAIFSWFYLIIFLFYINVSLTFLIICRVK